MMPRQNCPMCSNRPRLYVERELRRALEAAQAKITLLETKVEELNKTSDELRKKLYGYLG